MFLDRFRLYPHQPSLTYFIGCFDVSHRSDELDEELSKYDPNDSADRDLIIRRYCLELTPGENFRHRRAQFDLLEEALADPNFDFASIWEEDEDEFYSWIWPSNWPELDDPRSLFQAIRETAKEVWHLDLQRSNMPTLKSCREIPERDLGSSDWLFSVDNAQAWKDVFNLAVTPSDLKTKGPVRLGEHLALSAEGYLNNLICRPPHWPPNTAYTYCEFDVAVIGIGEIEVRGSKFEGQITASLTPLKKGWYLRMRIGFDCIIECVALEVTIGNVVGSHRIKEYGTDKKPPTHFY